MSRHEERRQRRRQKRREQEPVQLNSRLEELRTILYGGPTRRTWHELGELFDTWPDDETLPLGIEYAESHLEGWPATLRSNRGRAFRWLLDAFEGHTNPRARLLREGHIDRYHGQPLGTPVSFASLQNLQTLHVRSWSGPTEPLFTALCGAQRLPALRHLGLSGFRLHDTDINRLADTRVVPALESMALPGNVLTARSAQYLIDSPHLPRLNDLDLAHNTITTLDPLLRARELERLRGLDLTGNHLNAQETRGLLASGRLPHLLRLRFGRGQITAATLRTPAVRELIAGLDTCALPDNPITDEGVRHLTELGHTFRPRVLDLSGCRLGNDGILALASSPILAGVQELRLARNRFDSRALRWLLASEHLAHLTHLDLAQNELGEDSLRELAGAPFASRLTALDLQGARFTGAAAAALLARDGLPEALQGALVETIASHTQQETILDEDFTAALAAGEFAPAAVRAACAHLGRAFWYHASRHRDAPRLVLLPDLDPAVRLDLLQLMTVLQLRSAAREAGLSGASALPRAALVELLEAHLRAAS